MKQFRKINLVQHNKAGLSERELNRLLGGENCCICGCRGTSSENANGNDNTAGGTTGMVPADGGGGTWVSGSFSVQ